MIVSEIRSREVRTQAVLLLHFGFFLCGIATAMPGAVLPLLLKYWAFTDFHAGSLVATQFCTSAVGSLLVARQRHLSIRWGYGLALTGLLLLAVGLRQAEFAAFAAIGLGIGMAMTSTSLLISEIYPNRRAAALSLLNFSWGAGAAIAPAAVWLAAQYASDRDLFLVIAILFGVALLGALGELKPQSPIEASNLQSTRCHAVRIYFALMMFLYVGIESSIGNWVTTFAERSSVGHHASLLPYVASFFWGALLLGRAFTPVVLKVISETTLHLFCCLAAVVCVGLLLPVHGPSMLLVVAICAGLALAPIFPLGISALIARSPERSQLGWVFAVAGLGGACFTWMEGWLSTYTGSLRFAFWAPVAATVLMLVMAAIYPKRWPYSGSLQP